MTQQKVGKGSPFTEKDTPKYLWRTGELVEWEKATVHISKVGWTAVSAVFEGIRAYWNEERGELFLF